MCRFASLFKHLFPVQIDVFLIFLSGGVQETAKISHFVDFDWEKMHQNGLSGTYLGFKACQIQCCRFWVSAIRGSWKITISGKNFTFCGFCLGKMHWNCLSGTYLGFKACQIQWHLLWVSRICGSWKNHNFWRHIAENGVKTMKMGWNICSSLLSVQFYPYTMFQNPTSRPSSKKWRKTIITQKVLVTQSSNIVHCNQHTQKP